MCQAEINRIKIGTKTPTQSNETQEFQRVLKNELKILNYDNKAVGTATGPYINLDSKIFPQEFVHYSLNKIIKTYNISNRLDIKLIRQIYSDLTALLYDKLLPIKDIVPIYNFSSDEDHFRITEWLSVRKITNEEKEFILHKDDIPGKTSSIYNRELYSLNYIAEFSYVTKKIVQDIRNGIHFLQPPNEASENNIENLIIALRLLKKGVPYYTSIFRYTKLDLIYSKPMIEIPFKSYIASTSEQKSVYFIRKVETAKLKRLFLLIGIYKNKVRYTEIAINCFSHSYDRQSIEDKVIDYALCLEALFSYGSPDSLTYKLRTRCSRFIARGIKKRSEISDLIARFYTVRSAIVHGGNYEKKLKPTDLNEIEEYLKISIMKILTKKIQNKKQYEELLQRLDYG